MDTPFDHLIQETIIVLGHVGNSLYAGTSLSFHTALQADHLKLRWAKFAAARKQPRSPSQHDFAKWILRWAWEQANGYCMNPECRARFTINALPGDPSAPRDDHIIPSSCPGSTNQVTNIQVICEQCNTRKGGCQNGTHHHRDYRPMILRQRAIAEQRKREEAWEAYRRQQQQDLWRRRN